MLDCKLYLVIADMDSAIERKMEPKKIPLFPEASMDVKLTLPND